MANDWKCAVVRLAGQFAATLRKIDFTAAQKVVDRLRAARRLPPDNDKRKAWEAVGHMTPREINPLLKYLPDPTKRVGNPGGSNAIDDDMRAALAAAEQSGSSLTKAARCVLRQRGALPAQVKNKADYAVKVYRRSSGKN